MENKDIMDMLKLLLQKVERLEKIKTENVVIGTGSFATIECKDSATVEVDNLNETTIECKDASTVQIDNPIEINMECKDALSY